MSEFDRAKAAWRKYSAVHLGHSDGRWASHLLDKHGYLGGTADEFSPATERGREKIRALVRTALARGWAVRHYSNTYKDATPRGKWKLLEGFCPKCGKRPSYCRCGG